MGLESSLWQSLKGGRKIIGPWLHMDRVENAAVSGHGDVEGQYRTRGQFWLELKAAERPARASSMVRYTVRDSQVEWNWQRWMAGGNNWFLCQVGRDHNRVLYLIPGNRGAALQKGMTESAMESIATGGVFRGNAYHKSLFERVFRDS